MIRDVSSALSARVTAPETVGASFTGVTVTLRITAALSSPASSMTVKAMTRVSAEGAWLSL